MKPLPPDFDLWTEVLKSVKPLRRRQAAHAAPSKPAAKIAVAPMAVAHKPALSPPPLGALDRRTRQKMVRGLVDIDRRLDLHGTGIETARMRLLQFLRDAAAEGARTVLVITGKGESPFARHTLHGASHFHTPERQGRLRRLVPEWLGEPEFRRLAAGLQPAHPRHGGGGAYYVRIRRQRP
jgi:DNA-nicking Smr family endonuclease